MFRQTTRTFDATIASPRQARRFVERWLDTWGLAIASEPIVLGVSELMTNAVIHGTGPITLTLSATDDRVRIHVEDQGRRAPVTPGLHPGRRTTGRWGLHLVDELADDWGIDLDARTTGVWFDHQL